MSGSRRRLTHGTSPFFVVALAAMALTALYVGCAGDARRGVDEPRNVLILTLDTLRADRVGAYGYGPAQTPNLDRLAANGTLFEQASTVMPLTLPAHSSLFTGTFPASHGVRDNGGFYLDDGEQTLAETLAAAGFRTAGFVSAFVLDSRWGIAQGFQHFYDDFDLTEFDNAPGMDAIQRRGETAVDRALEWLDEDRESRFLAWVHLYDPHTPYDAPEPFRSAFPATREGAYDAEIAYADAQVGRVLDALAEQGRLEDTLVIVLGDHGEMLGEHGEPTHAFFIYEAAVHIPLIISGPGVPALRVSEPVRIVDVMPTVLSRLQLGLPKAVQGSDLSPLLAGQGLRLAGHSESWFPRYHYGWSELQSIRDGRYKLIRAPRRELYDLVSDPRELNDLAMAEPQIADRLEAALERMLERISSDEQKGPQAVDPQTADRLRALGYLGSTSRRHLEDGRPRGDPKDKIGLYNLLKESTAAAVSDNLELAITKVERALAEDPEIVEAHLLLGNFRRRAEELEPAIAAYRAALDLDPEHDEALFSLAAVYKDQGRLDDALAGFERAAELDPRNGKVIWQIADVHLRQGRYDAAEEQLLAALELDLDRPRFLVKLGECYYEMRRYGEAEQRLTAALAENPEIQGAHFTLGLVLEDAGQLEEAVAAYRTEIAQHDDAFRASFNVAKLLQRLGRPRQALDHYRRVLELQPGFGTGRLYLAKLLLDLGDLEAAEAEAQRGLLQEPEAEIAPLGHYVLADVYNRLGRSAEAEREIAAARRLEREPPG